MNKVIDIIVIVDKRTAIIKSVIGLYDHIKRKEMRIEGDRSFNVDSNGNIKTLNQNNWQKILKNIQNWRQSPLDTNKTPAEFIMQIFLKSIQLNTKQIQKIIPKVKDTLRNTYLIR